MGIFNLRILDASIQDVIVNLNDIQKADVLLHALQHLPIKGCRRVMENAVQSLLQVPNLPSASVTRALLLRAKGRFAAGLHTSAQQDLHSALTVDPENQDVKATIQSQLPRPETPLSVPDSLPHFPEELWRQIALLLPRRDLRSLLLVQRGLSRIADRLLISEIDLRLTTAIEPSRGQTMPVAMIGEDLDAWHDRRTADILMRILNESHFADQVRSLNIFAISTDDTLPLTFKVGILIHVLPKLSNLRKVHCSGDKELVSRVLEVIHLHNPRLRRLSLIVTGQAVDVEVPAFKHITRFTISSHGGSSSSIHSFLSETRDVLCHLLINNPDWQFPAQVISISRLTQVQFDGRLSNEALSEILSHGHHLESLMLSGVLEGTASSCFRTGSTALPYLRHFSLAITGLNPQIQDHDLCPTISDFLREHTQLQTYRFFVSPALTSRIGFDSSAWGVLAALSKLSGLSITYPKDLPPALAGWLIPRTVRALALDLSSIVDKNFMNSCTQQFRTSMPPLLRYISITNVRCNSITNVIEHAFPNVRVARFNENIWTVTRSGADDALQVEQWPYRTVKYYAAESLESLGCTDAIWEGVDGSWYI